VGSSVSGELNPIIETVANVTLCKETPAGGRRYPLKLKKQAVERLKYWGCPRNLGYTGGCPYRRDQLVATYDGDTPPENVKERDLRIQLATAKRLITDRGADVEVSKVP
jgi:hypothetical protein